MTPFEAALDKFVKQWVEDNIGSSSADGFIIRQGAYIYISYTKEARATSSLSYAEMIKSVKDKEEWNGTAELIIPELAANGFGEWHLSTVSGIHCELVNDLYDKEGKVQVNEP